MPYTEIRRTEKLSAFDEIVKKSKIYNYKK